jgi:hypothetical protein
VAGVFDTEILPKKELHQDEPVIFKVKFTGTFDHTYLQAEVKLPSEEWFPFPNRKTLGGGGHWFRRGTLTGSYNNHEFEWKGIAPRTLPPGKYRFRIRAYERSRYSRNVWLRLHVLHFLKFRIPIRSIDEKALDIHLWEPVHQQEFEITIKE